MKITYNRDENLLIYDKEEIKTDCIVRNKINGWRETNVSGEIVYGHDFEGNSFPYMPERFPIGEWEITEIRKIPKTHPDKEYLGEYFIATNAFQWLPVWRVDKSRGYLEPTQEMRQDTGYGFHFCPKDISNTSLGCGLVRDKKKFNALLKFLRPLLKSDTIKLEVI